MTEAGQRMIEVAEACWLPLVASMRRHPFKPGEAYLMLPESTRDTLQDLRSEDIAHVRWPPWR